MLGPLLFLLYVNDLPRVLKSSMGLLFADDFKVYKVIESDRESEALQIDLDAVSRGVSAWQLSLNIK